MLLCSGQFAEADCGTLRSLKQSGAALPLPSLFFCFFLVSTPFNLQLQAFYGHRFNLLPEQVDLNQR